MTDSPISFRPDAEQRKLIAELGTVEGLSTSAVIKRGLNMIEMSRSPSSPPLYARSVDDPDVDAAVEDAAKSACEVLDQLFADAKFPETKGISSNFQGLLADHLRAMLCGLEHANRSHSTPLTPLLARWDSFGRHVYSKAAQQGVTLVRPATKFGSSDLYFNEDQFVELADIDVGGLFTNSEVAVADYLKWMRRRGECPQDCPARLVVIDFSGKTPTPLPGN